MQDIEGVYKINGIVDLIVKEVGKTDVIEKYKLEEAIINHIGGYINRREGNEKHLALINRMVYEKVHFWKHRYRRYSDVTFSALTKTNPNDDGNETRYEPEDVLADVESEVIAKEMTALLAQDDHRKKVILGNWLNGNDNTSDIARLLAQTIGGNVEAHRKYIRRFQLECRDKLATAN